MYEGPIAVPLIIAGPDIREGKRVATNAMLVDIFPTILESVCRRRRQTQRCRDSLMGSADAGELQRDAFAEYHAIFSPSVMFMIRHKGFKYVHYVGPLEAVESDRELAKPDLQSAGRD
jgi:arylsulfatase A-like enzyme